MLEQRVADIDSSVETLVFVSDQHAIREPLGVLDRRLDEQGDCVQVLSVGDAVTCGIDPVDAVAWVRRRAGALGVRGNHDRNVAKPGRGYPVPQAGRP